MIVITSKQSDAIELQQRQGFEKLDQKLQLFVVQYASGNTKMRELFAISELSINDHTAKASMQSEEAVKACVTKAVFSSESSIKEHLTLKVEAAAQEIARQTCQLNSRAVSHQQRERLLGSFKFSGMNERRNDLRDSHEGTFAWIFDEYYPPPSDEGDWTTDYDSSDSESSDDLDHGGSDAHPSSRPPSLEYDCYDKPWDNFSDWLKSESNIYWISGKPGSGKSTLMKFIVESPATKEALQSWATDTLIVSHFFWKPGSTMQKNTKGLLCSILYQLSCHNASILDTIFSTVDSAEMKHSDIDWSVKELQATCLSILGTYPSHLCIFLDGADEVSEQDGPLELMRLVNSLRAFAHIKVCVASRPEPSLESRLATYSQLRLQDLTARDMEKYARETLWPFWDKRETPLSTRLRIVEDLMSKAEGVFLWLHLALRSLIDGLENDDTEEELATRLDELPNELSRLYWDMWQRLNGNTNVYRETSALFFNLLLDMRDIGKGLPGRDRKASLFEFMAATTPDAQREFIEGGVIKNNAELHRHCLDVQNNLKIRCAGLVEVRHHGETPSYPIHGSSLNDLHRLESHWRSKVTLIHRTAYDFLVDTIEGEQIRSYDIWPRIHRHLHLIVGKMMMYSVRSRWTPDKCLQFLQPLSLLKGQGLDEEIQNLLQIGWRLYDEHGEAKHRVYKPHFLAQAAFPAFHDFVVANIKASPDPSQLATTILRDSYYANTVHTNPDPRSNAIWGISGFLDLLLSLNADLHQLGFTSSNFFGDYEAHPALFISPFGCFLKQVLTHRHIDAEYVLRSLSLFLGAQNPRLGDRISLSLVLQYSKQPKTLGCEARKHLERSEDVGDVSPSGVQGTAFLVEANLEFWTQALLMRIRGLDTRMSTLAALEVAQLGDPTIFAIFFPASSSNAVKCYRVVDENVSGEIQGILWPWLCMNDRYGTVEWLGEAVDFAREVEFNASSGSRSYEECSGSMSEYLADRNFRYTLND